MIPRMFSAFRFRKEIEEYDQVDSKIRKDIVFRGTNLWVLIFAIIIACVGLNINSQVILIGAMLISPLMGPINGMGYSIAISDMELFKRAFKNFSFAITASLVASILYFALTPLSGPSAELLSRTSPTVYDVVVAFFGGMAGMIAISSQQKGNVIPGVAIATALLPPLCTAGFGIVTGRMNFFFGAMYLFTIYTICMIFAGVVVAQIIRFPIRRDISEKKKKRINHIITIVLIITILPSIYLAYILVKNEKFKNEANQYVKSVNMIENNYLINSDIQAGKKRIRLMYAGFSMTDEQKEHLLEKAKEFSLNDANIIIEEGFSLESYLEEDQEQETDILRKEINQLNAIIKKAYTERDSLIYKTSLGKKLLNEINPIYPEIQSCAYSEAFLFNEADSLPVKENIIFVRTQKPIQKSEQQKIERWLRKRLETENLKVYFE